MTRINSAIPVHRLTDEHLLAEHREVKRLPYCLAKAIKSGSIEKAPEKFTLGAGHILFFLDKLGFARERLASIHEECLKRGFCVADYSANFDGVDSKYLRAHVPSPDEHTALINRITDRIVNSRKKSWHYYGIEITKEQAVKLLNGE